MYSSEQSDFNGHKVFTVYQTTTNKSGKELTANVITFGLRKAIAIIDQIEQIKQFVKDNENIED